MATRTSSHSAATRVPFGDATSRANTPNAQQVPGTKRSVQHEYTTVPAAAKHAPSLSAVAPGPAPSARDHRSHHHRRQPQQRQQQQQQQQDELRELELQLQQEQLQQQLYEQQLYEQQTQQQLQQQQQQELQQATAYENMDLDPPDETTKRNSAASKDSHHTVDSRRTSQYSSCDGFPNKKSHIGPWQLGKTLGKGSSARVRAARHCVTHQPVAVKIIAKKTARMTQSGSIAQLDQVDSHLPENVDGVRRMPLAIEREVAILKLIEHPNIVKLYDIWENRNEIYLILEYVENGDLFTYVSRNGALTEEASVFVFRQMMSAVQYCHAYNICHRDLKPENILLKSDGQIKIADFGMAALHQGPRYHLQTSCGSPHYAAPELLKAKSYRGEKADIWSMGVILFVMLAGRLPFDEDDMSLMLAKAKKGIYTMPGSFSPDAKDLVHRILQVEPEVRISMNQMWQHPLVWKYGYLDDLGSTGVDGPGQGDRGTQVRPLDLAHIDTQIFRQLRSMWHTLREDDLAGKLVSNELNDQKLFYWLLFNYRDRQQENYNPTLTHSVSDYHHVNQAVYSKKVSTRQFSQSVPHGHKRSVSRFTVISNIAETEAGTESGTVKSYDPYKLNPNDARASHAKIVVHRNNPDADAEVRSIVQAEALKARTSSAAAKKRAHSHQRYGSAAYLRASRGSMSSLRSARSMRSINGVHTVARPSSRHRRNVDFSKARKASAPVTTTTATVAVTAQAAEAATSVVQAERVVPDRASTYGDRADFDRSRDNTLIWNEDLTDFSCKIAKDLDDAFMSSLLAAHISEEEESRNSPFSLRLNSPELPVSPEPTGSSPTATKAAGPHAWDSRPLPPSPPRSDSVQLQIMQSMERTHSKGRAPANADVARKDAAMAIGIATSSNVRYQVHAVDVQPPTQQIAERRVVSAPVYSQAGKGAARALPSIRETGQDTNWPLVDSDKPRAVSAPSKKRVSHKPQGIQGLESLAKAEDTIRVVVSPTAVRSKGLVATPKPLNLSKKVGRASNTMQAATRAMPDPRQQQQSAVEEEASRKRHSAHPVEEAEAVSEVLPADSGRSSVASSRKTWFSRRSSKAEKRNSTVQLEETPRPMSVVSGNAELAGQIGGGGGVPTVTKKKSFGFPFWKTSKGDAKPLGAEEDGVDAYQAPDHDPMARPAALPRKKSSKIKKTARATAHTSWYEEDSEPNGRKIDPQQNWLSRLFRVKPARRHLCLAMSQRRARQELSLLLREWRRYGLRDIEVDKEHNIVFARVGPTNYLGFHEVTFACEIITVIEHGKRNHLSIIRMTQEKGSANSFHKVADTIKSVMRDRNLVVADKAKAKMMVKTLNS